ncbi:RHS repeat-associated core domain-containing protein [Eubacterium ruminantium]|uniref:RHS repeat-associated core domain-containing protein n=1 Tax=Eubacterium ruminantium TaxID=42322 RepID=A0A1T4KJW6_9FIRM|nr:lectin-like protein [Eubacterium ruminantium]SCW32657.1 RHS repeat-associated core domain-containing protein [Eubacterium ruminantium]SJZ42676.1 RHS repeat-associated core domain-containing protein [Eubacterium ruminantium]
MRYRSRSMRRMFRRLVAGILIAGTVFDLGARPVLAAGGGTVRHEAQISYDREDEGYQLQDSQTDDKDSGDSSDKGSDKKSVYLKKEDWKGLEYALFSAGDKENLNLYLDKINVKGSIHTNSAFYYSGSKFRVSDALEASKGINIYANTDPENFSVKSQAANSAKIEMPDITKIIISDIEENTWDKYKSGKVFSGKDINLSKNVYSDGELTISGNKLASEGMIVAKENIMVAVDEAHSVKKADKESCDDNNKESGDDEKDNKNDDKEEKTLPCFIMSENGNISISGNNITLDAVIYAPDGTVQINANEIHLNGRIIAKNINISGSLLEVNTTAMDFDVLPEVDEKDDESSEATTEEVTEKNTTEEVTESTTSEDTTEKVTIEEITEKPTTEEVTEKPTTEEVTEKPTTEEVTEKPTTEEVTEKPTTEEVTEKPVTEAPTTEEVSAKKIKYVISDIKESYKFDNITLDEEISLENDTELDGSIDIDIKKEEKANDSAVFFRNNHAYFVSNDLRTWKDAEKVCEDMGGHLACINDGGENEYIRSIIQQVSPNGYTAIGFTDEVNEGEWRWINGQPVTYTRWDIEEPNNGFGGQNYAYMYDDGTWDDGKSDRDRYYICEWDDVKNFGMFETNAVIICITTDKDVIIDKDFLEKNKAVVDDTNPDETSIYWKVDLKENSSIKIPISYDKNIIYKNINNDKMHDGTENDTSHENIPETGKTLIKSIKIIYAYNGELKEGQLKSVNAQIDDEVLKLTSGNIDDITEGKSISDDYKKKLSELIEYPFFNIFLDKSSYVDGEDINVTTDINKILGDKDKIRIFVNRTELFPEMVDGKFSIKGLDIGNYTLKIKVEKESGCSFTREVSFYVYGEPPAVKISYDKDKYYDNDDVTLFVDDAYSITACRFDNEIQDVNEGDKSLTFEKVKGGLHNIVLTVSSENVKTETLYLYLYVNQVKIGPKLNDEAVKYDVTSQITGIRFSEDEKYIEILGSAGAEGYLDRSVLSYSCINTEKESYILISEDVEDKYDTVLGKINVEDLKDGQYSILLSVTDILGNTARGRAAFTYEEGKELTILIPKGSQNISGEDSGSESGNDENPDVQEKYKNDHESPITDISSPDETTEIKDKLTVIGTVRDETALEKYELTLNKVINKDEKNKTDNTESEDALASEGDALASEGDATLCRVIATGTEPVNEGVLGEVDINELTNGHYIIRLEAWDKNKNSSFAEVDITVTKDVQAGDGENSTEKIEEKTEDITTENPGEEPGTEELPEDPKDKDKPVVQFTAPESGDSLKVPTEIIGTVYDNESLSSWKLEYRNSADEEKYNNANRTEGVDKATDNHEIQNKTTSESSSENDGYILIAEGKDEIKNASLGTLDTTMLNNGLYEIRLTAKDKGQNVSRVSRYVYVEGNLKVGNMNIGFTDLTDNFGKLKVNVNRLYDSRNKESKDFGYGWNLDISGMKLIESHPITDGYNMSIDGAAFNMTYRMYETVSHDVMITYGDGSSDKFSLVINNGISRLTPVSEVSFGYRCVTNPKNKLEILTDTTAVYEGGSLAFVDDEVYSSLTYKLISEDGMSYYINKENGVFRIEDKDGNAISVDKNGYHSEDGSGITFVRGEAGRITSATNSTGKKIEYIYDKNGNLSEVVDSSDRSVKFTYDDKHNLTGITDPTGKNVARNEYDDDGRLIATIDADGNRVEFNHDIEGREEVITDRLGNSTIYVYDDNGNVIAKTDANGNTVKTTYDEYGNILTYTDARGNETVSKYDDKGNLTSVKDAEGNSISVQYDAENRPVKLVTVDDAVMHISYDDKGNVTETTDVDGSVIQYEVDNDGNVTGITDEIGKVISSEYDSHGRVIASTDAAGNRVEYTYDSQDHKLTETYTVITQEGEKERTIKYNYNEAGELISTEDPDGNISTVERNILGYASAVIDSEGHKTSYEYDVNGNVEKVTYPDGTSESFTYDAESNLIKAVSRTGNIAEYTYDKVGNLKKIVDARGNETLYDYDENYNLTSVTYATGAKISYKYDSLNRNTEVTDNDGNTTYFAYDSRSLLTSVTDAKGNVTRYEYNAKGERVKVIYPDETSVSIGLDVRGRVTSRTDVSGGTTYYTYNNIDRLISVKQPDGAVTEYTYDRTGNLLSFKDAKGRVTRYEYDESGRVIKTVMPDGSETSVEYDKHGYVIKTVDMDKSVTTYSYDDLGRAVAVQKSGIRNENEVKEKAEYKYDKLGRVAEIIYTKSGYSDRENPNNYTSRVDYTYDKFGCITEKTYDNGQKVSYGYDKFGRINEVSVNTKKLTTKYEYDAMDRLVRVISHDGKATVYTYDENGNRSTAKYANGITITYTYDECNRLKIEKVTDKNQKLISEYRYTTEKGERTKVSEKDSDGKEIETVYKYDECSRLLSESISVKKSGEEDVTDIQYTYDSVGSRISKTVNGLKTEYSYNELNQLIGEKIVGENASDDQSQNSSDNSKTSNTNNDSSSDVDSSYDTVYRYDKNGNLIETVSKDKKCTYTYDLFNRMTGYTDGVVNYTYTYDAEGVRRTKTCYSGDHSTTVMYITDTLTEFSQTLAETDENGQIGTCYTSGFELIGKTDFIYEVSGGSKDKIENESVTNDSTVELSNEPKHEDSYYILDGHSDVRMVLGSSAEVKASYRYSAYGEILEGTADLEDGYYYTGEYMDSETGLYYLRARYMNPATATFTSMDSYAGNIYDPASLHRYLYANANPVKYTDPSGHKPFLQVMVAVSIKVILSAAVTSCIMGVIGGIVSAGYAIVKGGDGRQVVSAFIDGFRSGAKIGAYLGALTAFVSYYFSISIIKASAAVALSHDGAIALAEFVIERDAKKLAKRVPFILLDIVFFRAAWISEAKSFLPGYDGHKGSISEYNSKMAEYLDEAGGDRPNIDIKIKSQQLGKKWGKHMNDYPDISSYTEYEEKVKDIFNDPDKIILDSANGEYLYIKGKDLLRIKLSGEFVSLYPGVDSSRVADALNKGGLLWEK